MSDVPMSPVALADLGLEASSSSQTPSVASLSECLGPLSLYSSDIHAVFRHTESSRHRVYDPNLRYLRYRRVLVDWLAEIGDGYGLNFVVVHTAVVYLDEILSQFPFLNSQLQLVAIGCLLLAAKYEEREEYIPTLAEMAESSGGAYTRAMISEMEAGLLQKLKWKLRVASPVHFIGYYARCGVAAGDTMHGAEVSPDRLRRHIEKYAGFYADLCLQEASFLEFLPSTIAAASVLTARRSLRVLPAWGPALERLSGYSEDDLAQCAERIFWVYSMTFPPRPAEDATEGQSATAPAEAAKGAQEAVSPTSTLYGAAAPAAGSGIAPATFVENAPAHAADAQSETFQLGENASEGRQQRWI